MPHLGDALRTFPVSGSWPSVYQLVAEQAFSSSFRQHFKPSGMETVGVMAVDENRDRMRLAIHNSGSQALLLGYGQNTTRTSFNEKILAFTTLSVSDPVFTGKLYLQWDASGTFSGSVANITEFTS